MFLLYLTQCSYSHLFKFANICSNLRMQIEAIVIARKVVTELQFLSRKIRDSRRKVAENLI